MASIEIFSTRQLLNLEVHMFSGYFKHKSLLHTILRFNAAFSGVFGLAFLFFPARFANWLGIPSTVAITITALLLFVWEFYVFQLVREPFISPAKVWGIIAGDLAWVLGSVVLLLGAFLPLTTAGKWFIAVIADLVLLFAIVQFFALRQQDQPA
jgi:hypothetical protein